MIYAYRCRASKSESEIKDIESIVHCQRDYIFDIEKELRKRGKKLEDVE